MDDTSKLVSVMAAAIVEAMVRSDAIVGPHLEKIALRYAQAASAAAHEHWLPLLDEIDRLRGEGPSEEEVARIIDPEAFAFAEIKRGWTWDDEDWTNSSRKMEHDRGAALTKARTILALRSSGPTEETKRTLQEPTKLDTTLRDVLTKFPTPAPDTFDRERLGKLVRHVWIKWARRQPDPKPSWLVPYEDLSEPDKEVDRQIGANIAQDIYGRILVAAEDALRGSDSDVEKPTPGASSAPTGWGPIETAPKDGRDILGAEPGVGAPPRICFWDEARGGIWSMWPGRERFYPTRWTYVPQPSSSPSGAVLETAGVDSSVGSIPSNKRIGEMEAALRFYRDNWTVPAIGPRGEPEPNMRLERDQGTIARQALTSSDQPLSKGDQT